MRFCLFVTIFLAGLRTVFALDVIPRAALHELGTGMVGHEIVVGGPDAVCFVRSHNQWATSTCSATLTKNNEVRTAAHCVFPGRDITVSCGFAGFNGPAQSFAEFREKPLFGEKPRPDVPDKWSKKPFFKETFRVKRAFKSEDKHTHDVALLELDGESKLTPMPILPKEQIEAFVSNIEVECRMSGYGLAADQTHGTLLTLPVHKIDHEGNTVLYYYTSGELREPQEQPQCDQISDGQIKPLVLLAAKIPAAFESGDSGGPLYCRKRDGIWKLIGIISRGRRSAQPGTKEITGTNEFAIADYNGLKPFKVWVPKTTPSPLPWTKQ